MIIKFCGGVPLVIVLFLLSVSGGGSVYTRLRVCRRRLAGLPSLPVHQGALRPAQHRPVFCQSPAAHRSVLPQPWCVRNLIDKCGSKHVVFEVDMTKKIESLTLKAFGTF